MMRDESGDLHTMVYPYTKAIIEGKATICYKPTKDITAEQFIKDFICPKYSTNDELWIETQGIIAPSGIEYHK